ncbi:MAG TPA: thioredoxin domain-containing protein [Candidatus Udaeobacter sp.]|nr:thioredoxin domain-containing protein [Candidatus Udaeobacter sp.]
MTKEVQMTNDEKMIAERLVSFVIRHFRGAFLALAWLVTSSGTFAEPTPAPSEHTNRLAHEKSPYLLQHAHNPVDWYPWGEEAFAKARQENKPIFLSVGYSTCHWCHVMAHESFENEEVATIMNREFVNIKVDREERPDVDRVYMTFVQATTGGGGWPMSVWLTPDLKPFVGGTYFPPEDRYGQPGFKKVLERVATAWKENHDKIVEQGGQIVAALRESQSAATGEGKIDAAILGAAYKQLDRSYDPKEGGFGNAPKFPRPVTLNFLTRFYARSRGIGFQPIHRENRQDADATAAGKQALEMALFTLRKMAAGGMHDHIGGGFHRYSVDRYWHVPHFEKMLYDQAQLAVAYLDAFQITRDEQYESVARDILDYVERDMTSNEGGFFSAEDADSPVAVPTRRDDRRSELAQPTQPGAHRAPLQKTAEGAFYIWTKKDVDEALGDVAEIFDFHYGVQAHGNAPEGSDPHDEFRGKNILIERHTIGETAEHFKKTEEQIAKSLAQSREKLFAIRSKRPRPHLDNKIIAAWNGLMVSAYARAAQVFGEPRYLEIAARGAKFLRTNLYEEKSKLLYRNYRGGRSDIEGFADDYAFVIQGLLDLYEASFDVDWLKFAVELQETQDRSFFDEKNGGYFSTSGKDQSVFLRMKDDNDGAEPAASSVGALNLLRLSQFRDDPAAEGAERARKTIDAFATTLSHFPSAMPQMLVALDYSLSKPRQIVIAAKKDAPETRALLKEVHRHFLPKTILLLADGADGQKYLGEKNEAIRAMSMVEGKPAAYLCENFTCKAPVTDAKQLAELLKL